MVPAGPNLSGPTGQMIPQGSQFYEMGTVGGGGSGVPPGGTEGLGGQGRPEMTREQY